MAWTSPRTWVTGAVVTAAQMNAHVRDNLKALLPLDATAWTTYTPTLTQSSAVTKTATRAKYTQIGNLVVASIYLDVTGAGSAASKFTVSLPVTASTSTLVPVGTGYFFDQSVGVRYSSYVLLDSTTTVAFFQYSATSTQSVTALGATGAVTAVALANLDVVTCEITYEAA